jgi:hypothetical protein
MFQGTRGIVQLVVSLVAAAVLAVGLCHLKELVEKQPGPVPLPMSSTDGNDR